MYINGTALFLLALLDLLPFPVKTYEYDVPRGDGRRKLADNRLVAFAHHGKGEEGVYAGDGYGLLWDSSKVTVDEWNKQDNPYRMSGYWMSITVSGVTGFITASCRFRG